MLMKKVPDPSLVKKHHDLFTKTKLKEKNLS